LHLVELLALRDLKRKAFRFRSWIEQQGSAREEALKQQGLVAKRRGDTEVVQVAFSPEVRCA
jgi:hypothetical protein